MDTYELITRNTAEVITEEEVRALAADAAGKRAYVGYEPSGVLHVGHMLTANKLIDLQEAGMEIVILLADIHAYLNDKGTFAEIRETAERMREQFVAYGLDPDATEFVLGSSFQLNEEYLLDLHALALETSLNRAQRAIAELQNDRTPKVSHVIYPLMQALDIEYLDLDLAIGGLDQRKVHVLHRDEIGALGYNARPCLHTPILADLSTGVGKMSASGGVTISMEDSRADIETKVADAFCPPTRDPDPVDFGHDPETDLRNPVLEAFEYHVFPRFETVVVKRDEEYGGNLEYEEYDSLATDLESGTLHPLDAKDALAEYLDRLIAPGRDRIEDRD